MPDESAPPSPAAMQEARGGEAPRPESASPPAGQCLGTPPETRVDTGSTGHPSGREKALASTYCLPFPNEKIAVLAITRHGIALAGKVLAALPGARLFAPEKFRREAEAAAPGAAVCYAGKTGDQVPALFSAFAGIVGIVSLGALVRLVAPHLKDKSTDPGVVVLDEAGRFAIPMLSGHLGGANALAGRLAQALGATPVLTTASDARQTLAVDLLGRELGWSLEADHDALVRASAALVNDAPVALVQEAGSPDWWRHHANSRSGPLPANLRLFQRLEEVETERFAALLWISGREMPADFARKLAGKSIIYRPNPQESAPEGGLVVEPGEDCPRARGARVPQPGGTNSPPDAPGPQPLKMKIALGLGCDRGTPADTIRRAVAEALAACGADWADVAAVASIDLKADEIGLQALALERGWTLAFHPAARLAAVPVPNPSETVRKYTGTPSVSEAAALLAAGAGMDALLIEKHKVRGPDGKNATVSIARISP